MKRLLTSVLLVGGSAAHAAIVNATLTPSVLVLNEGESLSVTLEAESNLTGPGEGIYEIMGSVDWGAPFFLPPGSILEGATVGFPRPNVIGSTGNVVIPDDGLLSLTFSGFATEVEWVEFIPGYLTGVPINFTALNQPVSVTVLNLAPTLTLLPGNLLLDAATSGLLSFNAWATDPGENDVLSYAWDLNGDGKYDDASGASTDLVDLSGYAPGVYHAGLEVGDGDGGFDYAAFTITIVPEPGTALALALVPLAGLVRRRARHRV